MTSEELNTAIYEKMTVAQRAYRDRLLMLPPDEILQHAYEYAVRQDILIRNEDELIHAMNHFELRGGGGTDFRPAFEYVDQLCAEKKFSNLRGLLYFTDGMGTYPARRPGYDTAFLFLGERFDDANVPPWAMKVVLDEEEFTGAAARPASALADALAEEDDLYHELNNS